MITMSFLDSIRSDVKKEAQVLEQHLLLKVLQRRSQELTMGELFKLLGSPLGQDLHTLRVAELFSSTAPSQETADPSPRDKMSAKVKAPKRTKRTKKSKKTFAARGESLRGKPAPPTTRKVASKTAERTQVSAITAEGRKKYDSELLAYLREHPGPNRPASIRSIVGGSILQLRRAMERLREAGFVERHGKFGTTTYSARAIRARAATPTRSGARAKSSTTTTRHPEAPSGSANVDDDAVLAALRELGGWESSTQILSRVGGSIDALRESLKRLVANGSVRREGERKFTRYAFVPDAA